MISQNTTDFSCISVLEDNANTGYFYSDGSFVSSASGMWDASTSSMFGRLGRFWSGSNAKFKITELILINSAISREDTSENLHGEIITDISNFYGF